MTLLQQLHAIRKERGTIRSVIARDILNDRTGYDGTPTEQVTAWFGGLMRGGCASGFVGHLIYTVDTNKFFDDHYEEIMELKIDWEESTGEAMKIGYSLKNDLAWFAYERTADLLAQELGIEL